MGGKKPGGELVGLDLLPFVEPSGPGLAHVALGAGEGPANPQLMSLQQEMSKLVRDAEPRRLEPAPTVDQNLSMAGNAVGGQDTLAAVELVAPDLRDSEG